MKKVLAIGLVSLALAQAKVFIGVQGGYDLGGLLTKTGGLDAPIWAGNTTGGWSVGANLGVEHGSGFLGLRYFLSFDYSRSLQGVSASSKNFSAYDVDLNVDIMLNLIRGSSLGLGLFAGAGAGYQYISFADTANNRLYSDGNIPIFGRAGVTLRFGERIRVDAGVKIPIMAFDMLKYRNAPAGDAHYYAPLKIQGSIRFLF